MKRAKLGLRWRLAIVCATSFVTACSATLSETETRRAIIVPMGQAAFVGPNRLGDTMVSAALLRMDPAIPGSLSALLEMSRGATLRHYHTFDEQVVVIEGMVRHLSEGSPDAGPMPTGSYWFQPAGAVHQDICASDRCIIFVYQHSGGDTIVAPSD